MNKTGTDPAHKEPAPGMVENRGTSLWMTHVLMITGVLIVFFPIWLAFVASTVSQSEIVTPPMPLLPGEHFIENYKRALFSGVNVPVADHACELDGNGSRHCGWKDYYLPPVRLCHRVLPVSRKKHILLADLHNPDAPG